MWRSGGRRATGMVHIGSSGTAGAADEELQSLTTPHRHSVHHDDHGGAHEEDEHDLVPLGLEQRGGFQPPHPSVQRVCFGLVGVVVCIYLGAALGSGWAECAVVGEVELLRLRSELHASRTELIAARQELATLKQHHSAQRSNNNDDGHDNDCAQAPAQPPPANGASQGPGRPAAVPSAPLPAVPDTEPEATEPEAVEQSACEGGRAFKGPYNGRFLKGCFQGCKLFSSLSAAQQACTAGCGGVTLARVGAFELRATSKPLEGKSSEQSWVRVECSNDGPDSTVKAIEEEAKGSEPAVAQLAQHHEGSSNAQSQPVQFLESKPKERVAPLLGGSPTPEAVEAYKARLAAHPGCHGVEQRAFTTLCTGTRYVPAIMTLARALQEHKSQYPLVVMVTPGNCASLGAVLDLLHAGAQVCLVEHIDNPHPREGFYGSDTYSKINVWALPLQTAVFLDGDVLPRSNIDDYFDKIGPDMKIASSTDCGNSRKFYSGLMITNVHRVDFADMVAKVQELTSSDGGDLGFINSYFLGTTDVRSPTVGEKGFQHIAETDHWVRSRYCNKGPGSSSVLPKWVAEGDYDGTDLEKEEAAINAHLDEIRVIHYPGHTKPWWHCHDAENCNTQMGRGGSLDKLYIQTMQRYGLWGNGEPVRAVANVHRPSSLDAHHVRVKCNDYDPSPGNTYWPRYHLPTVCGGDGTAAEDDALRLALANFAFESCGDQCVFDAHSPESRAWRWEKGGQCWHEERKGGETSAVCVGQAASGSKALWLARRRDGVFRDSPAFHASVVDVCNGV